MVDPDGSDPASAEPSRIEKNGIAIRIITPAPTAANSAGRFSMRPAQRAQPGDSSVVRSSPALSCAALAAAKDARIPKKPSSAGSSVSAAITVNATAMHAAIATPYRKLTPSANRPSRAMQTIIPANSTARPEVSTDSITASSPLRPRSRPWR